MTNTFVEYRDITVTEPLRQGDVIEAIGTDASKWQRHLLVITADCDFANAKHQGRVTCVPLLSQDEYLLEFQIPRLRERAISKCVSTLQVLISGAGGPSISESRLREWPNEQDPTAIVNTLGLSGALADDVSKVLTAIRTATHRPDDLDRAVERIVSAQVDIPNGKKPATALREVTEALKSHYARPPGDALFLSAVAPNLHAGYFVYLRHLEQVSEPDIAIGPTRTPARYRRLARLQDRFIHAVSQQFALVFMSIGLPREYEELRDFHSDILGERYQ